MNPALKLVEQGALQARATETRNKHTELERDAQAAEQAAQAALAASRAAKTLEAANASNVQVQSTTLVAANLRREADAFFAANKPLFDEAERELKTEKLANLDETILSRHAFDNHIARIKELLADFRRDLRGELVAFSETIRANNETRAMARRLAESLGRTDHTGRYQPADLRRMVNEIVPDVTHYSEMDSMANLSIVALNGEDGLKVRVHISDPLFGGSK
jgi:hypothetical protein